MIVMFFFRRSPRALFTAEIVHMAAIGEKIVMAVAGVVWGIVLWLTMFICRDYGGGGGGGGGFFYISY